MKETIEAFAVYRNGGIMNYFDFKEDAEADVFHHGGTVVRLTGEMPRPLRKISTEVWIAPREPDKDNTILERRLGIKDWDMEKLNACPIRARITMEELPEEGEG